MMVPEKCLDSQLWHACAGGMVQMPSLGSKVYYFPQGHAEHSQGNVDFGPSHRIPAMILCKVGAIKFLAERDTDEVFVKLRLIPVSPNEPVTTEDDTLGVTGMSRSPDQPEKPASFAKTLTQSDANNGGGFSVPRYCAETIFPRLDYSSDPPVQTILARDVHGEVWKFRHIYRGTPRRHLLTTGWSTFVNQKKLVAGDSVVFLRADNGDLCIGIRRAKRGIGSGLECPVGWSSPLSGSCLSQFGGFSSFLREDESKIMRNTSSAVNNNTTNGMSGRRRVTAESVVEAATLAANLQPFEVVYYPRASTPEFCVKASAVREATRFRWSAGMRFKMAFETEDSSRISWFMGTISGVQAADPGRWPTSPWRILQVTWDEPELLQNVKLISPWLVELVSNFPAIHIPPFSPPRKKLRLPQHPEHPLQGQLRTPVFPNLWPSSNSLCYPLDSTPAGIQGARHAQLDTPFPDLHVHRLQASAYPPPIRLVDYRAPSLGPTVINPSVRNDFSCSLTIGNVSNNVEKSKNTDARKFMLFGQTILTEKQLSLNSGDNVSAVLTGNSSSDGNTEKSTNLSNGSGGSTIHQRHPSNNSSCDGSLWYKEHQMLELGLETGHCKVFMESEDVGRTLNLSSLSSYDELQKRLTDMFGIENMDILSRVLYRDQTGSVKHVGDEPFSGFARTVRRLTILMDSGSDNMGRQ